MGKEQFGKWSFTEEELNRQFEEASRLGQEEFRREPRARRAYYDGNHRTLVLEMLDGSLIVRPVARIQGLSHVRPENISRVVLTEDGDTLQWETLGLDLSVAGLVSGVLGSRAWMAELGRKGGSVTTPAKAAAARANGQKGGRPAKEKVHSSFTLSLEARVYQAQMDLIGATLAGQSHMPTSALAKYEADLTAVKRKGPITLPIARTVGLLITPASPIEPVQSSSLKRTEPEQEDDNNATFPLAA